MLQNTYEPTYFAAPLNQTPQYLENQNINIYTPIEQNQNGAPNLKVQNTQYINPLKEKNPLNQLNQINNKNENSKNQTNENDSMNNKFFNNLNSNYQNNSIPNQNGQMNQFDYFPYQNNEMNQNIPINNQFNNQLFQNLPNNNQLNNHINQNVPYNNINQNIPNNNLNQFILNENINKNLPNYNINQYIQNGNIIQNTISNNNINQNFQNNNINQNVQITNNINYMNKTLPNNNQFINQKGEKFPLDKIKSRNPIKSKYNINSTSNLNYNIQMNNYNGKLNQINDMYFTTNNGLIEESKFNQTTKPQVISNGHPLKQNPHQSLYLFPYNPKVTKNENNTNLSNQRRTFKKNNSENKFYNKLDFSNNNFNKYNNNTNKSFNNNNNKNTNKSSDNNTNKGSNNNANKSNNKNKKNNNISKVNQLKLNEQILLKNQKQSLNKDLDIKTHFDIEVTKERFLFNYKKVLKIAIPLLSHYEMPSDCEYKSPLLSPDGQYLSCIAKASTDSVYVWDVDDLYWYKYKFSNSKNKIECVAFTPDSKSILILYKKTSPILYNLGDGKKILELQKINEENKKESSHWAFTQKAAHFGYTTDESFILWSMKSGKIQIQIKDNSPIKLLFNEYIISINNDLICEIKEIKTSKMFLSFKLKGIKTPDDILDARCTSDMSAFIYVIKKGIIKYIFKEKKFKGLQKFQPGVEKVTISDDCRYVVKTNMRNLTIYDIEKGDTIGTILKEKFNDFRIDFNNEKLLLIDNICINIHDYTDGGIPEKFVWLNKNPNRFLDAKFSYDFKFLFALIDQNNVIAYDLNTGLIVKKWQNIDKNWTNFTISENPRNEIATNSNLFLVKLWNYITGREDATFYGYDSHSFHFSSNGNYLACGAKNGPEVARIWDIEKGTFGSFPYVGNNSNFHTIVHLTSPEPTRLICCSIDQQPLIFDTNSKELLYKCECLYRFEEIYEIKSDQTYDVFIVKGRDIKKREIGLLYRISDGILLETYENYSVLELAKDQGVIISKCDNVNGGKLTATDVKNLSDPILNDFQIQTDKIKLLNDNKCVVVVINEEEYKKEYCLMNAEDGGYFGKINFVKKTERNSENYITIDPLEEFIYFRYFEFLSPQESRDLRNKTIFRNSE